MTNLLKNNAYHILGLDSSASQKDIVKRAKDLTKFIQIEDIPKYDLDLDVFHHFRTEDSVKDALQRLTSPKKQIKEYFFWFNIHDDVDEQAVYVLRKNDFEGAVKIWEHHSQGDNAKALFYKKNLAILYCLLMFKQDSGYYLNASLKIWHELLNSAKFWNAFAKVYKLNDELSTNQETIDEFQKNCVSYLGDLYTDIATSKKDNKYVAEFSNVFKTKGGKTSQVLLAPIFNEMTGAIEKLEHLNVAEDGVFHKEKSAALKENVAILQKGCNKLVELGLFDDSEAKIVRERAADVLRSISVELHNDPLNETAASLGLAKIALQISGTEGSKNKIQEDLNQIQKNIDYKNNEDKIQKIIDPILKDYKAGNSDLALRKLNEVLYDANTAEEVKKSLREIKDVIEERVAKHGKPGSPSMGTFNTIGLKMYGDTLYFVALFIPLIPISRWSCEDHGNGTFTFYGQLELTQAQKNWRTAAILIIIILVIIAISSN